MSLLPPNATPFERALERGLQLDAIGAGAEAIDDPAAAPADVLPWLAWGLSVDSWDPNWSEEVKREAIAGAIAEHRRKGTRASVETVLGRLDDLATIVEWHEASPRRTPHTFEVHVPIVRRAGEAGGYRAGPGLVRDILRELPRVKPLREHMRVVQSVLLTGGVGVMGAARLASYRRDTATLDSDAALDWPSYLETEQGEPMSDETGALLATDRVGFDFSGGRMPPGATLRRASPGYVERPGGTMTRAAIDTPRFAYRNGRLLGLLVEPASTNLMRSSDAIAAAPWAGSQASIVSDAAAAPDGSITADRYLSASGDLGFYQNVAVEPGQQLVFSCYVRLDTLRPTDYLLATYDVGTRQFVAMDIAPPVAIPVDRWHRLVFPIVVPAGCQLLRIYPFRNRTATGSFASWGHQLEARLSSYISTAAAPASRAPDILALDWRSRGLRDGFHTVHHVFDDGTTQDIVTEVAGGIGIVPPLTRSILRRVEASA